MEITESPFTILIDTQEVYPWDFRDIPGLKGQGQIIVPQRWHSLGPHCGDYTIEGTHLAAYPHWRLSIERKSLSDLYSTILSRRRLFVEELETLNDMEYAAVVVECNLPFVLTHTPRYWKENKVPIEKQLAMQRSVIGSIQAWQLRYPNVRWWFLPRKYCGIWVYRLLNRFYEDKIK